ncbi:hypothetical protein BP5796_07040 [Coleophoma crateriformis]|uniref:CENP-V/GFA domain-containing protein n=1 Tax=Coleophoma crateriformis TaxID=565419 RepID=A0A3D8RI41_9HELO|nr:hypothetical protein BP5796_07040 [Coleophoma crateriformis]
MAPAAGSCSCGAVKITFDTTPEVTVICHCTQCQKMTSGPFTTSVIIELDKLKVDGETKTYTSMKTGSGLPSYSHFCPVCGTMLYGTGDWSPGKAAVRTGVLDGDGLSRYVPSVEINAESKAKWLASQEGTMVFQKKPPAALTPRDI